MCPAGHYSQAGYCKVCPTACLTCTAAGCLTCISGLLKAVDGCFPALCGDGHTVQGEECDDGVNAPGSACVNCHIAAPCALPRLVSAEWNSDFSGFALLYTEEIESKAAGCDVFAERDWLGLGAECDVQGKALVVRLGTAPALRLPLVLHIQPGTLLGYFCPYMTHLSVLVTNGPIKPLEVAVVGPNQVSPCDLMANFTLQPSLPLQLQGISHTSWTLFQLLNGHWQFLPDQTAAIQTHPLSASFKPPTSPGLYSLAAQSRTWAGETASAVWEFEALETGRVSVSVGVGEMTVRTEEQLTFRAEIAANWTCLGRKSEEIAVSWALVSNSSRISALNQILAANPYGRILPLPAYFLRPGETALIQVSAQLPSLPDSLIWTSFSLSCESSPLYAVVERTQIRLGQGQNLTLDASQSYRSGSTVNITFQWHCRTPSNSTISLPNPHLPVLSVPTESWTPGLYQCSVEVKDDLGADSATVEVEIAPFGVLSSPYLLSLLQGRPLGTLQPCQLWLWASPYSTAEVAPSTSANLLSDPALSRMELVRKLESVAEVTIKTVTETAVWRLSIETAGTPFGGEVEVKPEVGVAFVTDFRICAKNWIGEGKKYQFLYETEGVWEPLTDFLYSSCVVMRLPQGHGETFTVRLGVRVCSQWEACGLAWVLAGSQPWTYALGPSATLTDAANTLLLSTDPGDYEAVTRAVLLLAPALPFEPIGQSNECLCFNGGRCESGKCICPEDWTGEYCEVLVRDARAERTVVSMLESRLRQALPKLPATATVLELTLSAFWALSKRGEVYISESLDDYVITYLTSKGPYTASDWVYTDITLHPVPLTRNSAELLANIAAASLSRTTPIHPSRRLALLQEALKAKAVKSLTYEGRTAKLEFGTSALPLTSLTPTWSPRMSVWTNITLALNSTAEPTALTYIITTVFPLEWKASRLLVPVVIVEVVGQWSARDVRWQWIVLGLNFTVSGKVACVQWNETLWDRQHCSTAFTDKVVCNCSQGHVFSLIESQESLLPQYSPPTKASLFPWIPLITYCVLTSLCLCGLVVGRLKDSSDSSLYSSVQNLSNSDIAIVSGDNPLSDPRTLPDPNTLTLLQAFKNCHSLLALFYRYDRSVSRPSRVLLYLCRLTTMSAMILYMQELPRWIPWIGFRSGLMLACIQVFIYLISSLLLRVLKTYPEDAICEVSSDPNVNMVQVLKHSPQIKLFERREDLPSVQPFEPLPPLRQTELQLTRSQRLRAGAGLVASVGLIVGAGVAHSAARTDVAIWAASFPALAVLDCLVVQAIAVAIQYCAIKEYSLGCPLLSRSLRSLKP